MKRPDISHILLSAEELSQKVRELGAHISKDYEGKELLLVCILKGGITFTADLMRCITVPVKLDFVRAASYGAGTVSRGIAVTKDVEIDITGRHVLLVDAIVDSGETLDVLMKRYAGRNPAGLDAVVLLDKKPRRRFDVKLSYVGFEIPDYFVVGYGMDCGEHYRNLPYVAIVKT